jgi:copper chaperone NosL
MILISFICTNHLRSLRMKKIFFLSLLWLLGLVAPPFAFSQDDLETHPECRHCGMNRGQYAQSRMLIRYLGGKATGTCSIHCTASEMTVNRDKIQEDLEVADYFTHKLIPAEKANWVIGGNRPGVMTKRAKWAFSEKKDALRFIQENGGQLGGYKEVLEATFVDMYEDIRMIRERRKQRAAGVSDIKQYPECKYCGMNRETYAHSRALVEYEDGTVVGFCSIHCLSIDLALNTAKIPKATLIGDYYSKKLVDVEKAYWVLGGNKMGVMSIRGKWAFEKKEGGDHFIKENGGRPADFDKVMQATFEDMYEILR